MDSFSGAPVSCLSASLVIVDAEKHLSRVCSYSILPPFSDAELNSALSKARDIVSYPNLALNFSKAFPPTCQTPSQSCANELQQNKIENSLSGFRNVRHIFFDYCEIKEP